MFLHIHYTNKIKNQLKEKRISSFFELAKIKLQ